MVSYCVNTYQIIKKSFSKLHNMNIIGSLWVTIKYFLGEFMTVYSHRFFQLVLLICLKETFLSYNL